MDGQTLPGTHLQVRVVFSSAANMARVRAAAAERASRLQQQQQQQQQQQHQWQSQPLPLPLPLPLPQTQAQAQTPQLPPPQPPATGGALWVFGVDVSVPEAELFARFTAHGRLRSCALDRALGAALIEFESADDARVAAAALHGTRLGGGTLNVASFGQQAAPPADGPLPTPSPAPAQPLLPRDECGDGIGTALSARETRTVAPAWSGVVRKAGGTGCRAVAGSGGLPPPEAWPEALAITRRSDIAALMPALLARPPAQLRLRRLTPASDADAEARTGERLTAAAAARSLSSPPCCYCCGIEAAGITPSAPSHPSRSLLAPCPRRRRPPQLAAGLPRPRGVSAQQGPRRRRGPATDRRHAGVRPCPLPDPAAGRAAGGGVLGLAWDGRSPMLLAAEVQLDAA